MEEILERLWNLNNVKFEKELQKVEGREVHKISSDEGIFILKILTSDKKQNDLDKDTFIFDYLKDKEFENISRIIKSKNDNNYEKIDNRFGYILEYVEGKNPEKTKETYKKLAEILAKLHNISFEDYKYKSNWSIESEMPWIEEKAKELPFGEEYIKLFKQLPDFSKLPKSIIHTDVHPGNSIQKSDDEIILIDWDDVGIGTTILDLGFFITQQFLGQDLSFDKESAKLFFDAYLSKRTLIETEKKYLIDAGLFYSLVHLPFGNIDNNWKMIQHVIKHKGRLELIID